MAGLANHTLLIRKDGSELNIDDSGVHRFADRRPDAGRRPGIPRHHAAPPGGRSLCGKAKSVSASSSSRRPWESSGSIAEGQMLEVNDRQCENPGVYPR